MTGTGTLLEARPRLRPDIVLGPGLVKGPAVAHTIKDQRTGRYLQVGEREFFVISRLDGETSLAQIGAAYAERFGRSIGEAGWGAILGKLGARHLLVGTAPGYVLAELELETRMQVRRERTLLKARLPLLDPDRFLTVLRPRLAFLFSGWFVVPALLAVLAVEVGVLTRLDVLWDQSRRLDDSTYAVVVTAVVYWLSVALHEIAHGLACKHYGGSAHEIGLLWRFPLLAPYCNSNDVVLFADRRHRAYVAFAGVFTTLVLLVPVALLWLLVPEDSSTGSATAALLLIGSAAGVLNLVPVFQLDGYFILNHLLNMQLLRKESYRYLLLRSLALTGRAPAVPYPARSARVYAAYGTVSLLTGAAAAVAAVWWLASVLRPAFGAGPGWAVAVGIALAVAAAAAVGTRQRRRQVLPTGGVPAASAP